ncbi:MAG TPA: TIGR03667 family PPOX class F420-dependent oxidoreductase [Micromonosporaceae bacterium]|jgi:PPOX class probable F420-dependent enzyme
MTSTVLPDASTPFGARVAERLRTEPVIWLTTVAADGTPQPNPVWFIADGPRILVYNRTNAVRLRHIQRNPRVALHFNATANGGDVVVLVGTATIRDDQPPCYEVPAYVAKYGKRAAEISGTVEAFAAEYAVAVRIDVDRVRGF